MTTVGLLHIGSLLYLSGVVCLAVSVNENNDARVIIKETFRRWGKFLGVTLALALIVHLLSR